MGVEAAAVDLTRFCKVDCVRHDISTPFAIGGFLYATNQFICVRCPTSEPDTVRRKLPSLGHLPWKQDGEWKPLPEITTFICQRCGGTGEAVCSECRCARPCPSCNTVNVLDCTETFDSRHFRIQYLLKIRELPNVEYLHQGIDGSSESLLFRFDGGEGLLAACSEPVHPL